MVDCSFCGELIEKGTGVTYVKKDAKIFHFCSRKCEKNMIQLKRKPRNVTWTAEHRQAKAQMLAAGSSKKTKKKPVKAKSAVKTPAKTTKAPRAGKNAAKKQKGTTTKSATVKK